MYSNFYQVLSLVILITYVCKLSLQSVIDTTTLNTIQNTYSTQNYLGCAVGSTKLGLELSLARIAQQRVERPHSTIEPRNMLVEITTGTVAGSSTGIFIPDVDVRDPGLPGAPSTLYAHEEPMQPVDELRSNKDTVFGMIISIVSIIGIIVHISQFIIEHHARLDALLSFIGARLDVLLSCLP